MYSKIESNALSRDLSLVDTLLDNIVMRSIYLTLAISFGHHFLGFPYFAPSETHLLLIVIGAGAAIGLGLGWVALRQIRRTNLLSDEIGSDNDIDA